MDILKLVARGAGRGHALIFLVRVAGGASNLLVAPRKGKMRSRMIEGPNAGPDILTVTALARVAEPPLMRIGVPVAVNAAAWCFAELYVGQVAAVASRVLVSAIKLKVRKGVIERFPVELHDVGGAAFVVRMAAFALGLRGIRTLAMHPASEFPILGDVLVAGEAKARLRGFGESLVAICAVFFELRVPLDEWPRHDELLENVLRRRCQNRCANG